MNLEMNESKIGAIFIMTQLNCQLWLFFLNIFILEFPQYKYYFFFFFFFF